MILFLSIFLGMISAAIELSILEQMLAKFVQDFR